MTKGIPSHTGISTTPRSGRHHQLSGAVYCCISFLYIDRLLCLVLSLLGLRGTPSLPCTSSDSGLLLLHCIHTRRSCRLLHKNPTLYGHPQYRRQSDLYPLSFNRIYPNDLSPSINHTGPTLKASPCVPSFTLPPPLKPFPLFVLPLPRVDGRDPHTPFTSHGPPVQREDSGW